MNQTRGTKHCKFNKFYFRRSSAAYLDLRPSYLLIQLPGPPDFYLRFHASHTIAIYLFHTDAL
jgi:hypothetical protein